MLFDSVQQTNEYCNLIAVVCKVQVSAGGGTTELKYLDCNLKYFKLIPDFSRTNQRSRLLSTFLPNNEQSG